MEECVEIEEKFISGKRTWWFCCSNVKLSSKDAGWPHQQYVIQISVHDRICFFRFWLRSNEQRYLGGEESVYRGHSCLIQKLWFLCLDNSYQTITKWKYVRFELLFFYNGTIYPGVGLYQYCYIQFWWKNPQIMKRIKLSLTWVWLHF